MKAGSDPCSSKGELGVESPAYTLYNLAKCKGV